MSRLLLTLVLLSSLLPRGVVHAQAETPVATPPFTQPGDDPAGSPSTSSAPPGAEIPADASAVGPGIVSSPDAMPGAPQASEHAVPDPNVAALKQWTRQLVELEVQARELKAERAKIRTTGYRVGRAVAWGLTGVLAFGALSAFGTAELVEQALKDGDTDEDLHDSDGDGDVDRDDERHSRRIARGLAISSLVPIGVGVFTTVMLRKRWRERARLTRELEDLDEKRGAILERMRAVVEIDAHRAALDVRITF